MLPGIIPAFSSVSVPPSPTRKIIFLKTVGAGTWTVPLDWAPLANSIECISGGSGGGAEPGGLGGAGGGGGGYARSVNLPLTPGQVMNFNVGVGGVGAPPGSRAGSNGGDTWLNSTAAFPTSGPACGTRGAQGAAGNGGPGPGGGGGYVYGLAGISLAGGNGGIANAGGNGGGGGGGAAGLQGPGLIGGTTAAGGGSSGGGGGGTGYGTGGGTGSASSGGGPGGSSSYTTGGGGGAVNTPGGTGSHGSGGGGAGATTVGAAVPGGGGGQGDSDWTATVAPNVGVGAGPGGGGGGSSASSTNPNGKYGGPGGNYGGGGGGAGCSGSPSNVGGGDGSQGIIVITYGGAAIDFNTILLCHMDGPGNSFVDSSYYRNSLVALAGYTTTTSVKKFGAAAGVWASGVNDGLQINSGQPANQNFSFGTGDFTIEFWVNFAALTPTPILFDMRPPSTAGAYPVIYVPSSLLFYHNGTGNAIAGTTTLVISTWYHIALVRSSGVTKMYLNGVQEGSSYSDSNNYINTQSGRPVFANDSYANNSPLNGWMDEICVSRIARWTANFTPPTAPYS